MAALATSLMGRFHRLIKNTDNPSGHLSVTFCQVARVVTHPQTFGLGHLRIFKNTAIIIGTILSQVK